MTERRSVDNPPHRRVSLITIHNYSSLVNLDLIQAPTGAPEDDGFVLTLQNYLTKQLSQLKCDVVICATGYDRSSWLQLWRWSELGKHFIHGASSSSAPVCVLPDHAQGSDSHTLLPLNAEGSRSGMTDSSTSTSSSVSTPPTFPGPSSPIPSEDPGYCGIARGPPSKVYVTRAYRLVPKD